MGFHHDRVMQLAVGNFYHVDGLLQPMSVGNFYHKWVKTTSLKMSYYHICAWLTQPILTDVSARPVSNIYASIIISI